MSKNSKLNLLIYTMRLLNTIFKALKMTLNLLYNYKDLK